MLDFLLRWFGPVFAKEMIEVARRRRYYFNRIVYGAALFVAIWIAWEAFGGRYWGGQPMTIAHSARLAGGLFLSVSVLQYGAVWALVPVLLCAAIAGEREAHTLDLLLTTKLNDREIVLGKLGGRVVLFLAFVASGIPVVAITMLFGGVDAGAVWRVQLSTLLATAFAASHAIYFSTTTHTPLGALVRTYFWLAVWLLGLPALGGLFVGAFNIGPRDPAAIIIWGQAFINPIAGFIAAIDPRFLKEVERFFGGWVFPASFVIPSTVAVVLVWRSVARLRRPAPARRWVVRVIDALRRGVGATSRAVRGGGTFRPVRFGHYHRTNPLLVRARQALVYDRERHLFMVQVVGSLAAYGVILFLAFESPRDLNDDDMAMSIMATTWIGVALLAALVSAGSLVGDRRRGFLDQVLVTPLEAREIVDGTVRAAMHHVRIGVWLALSLTVVFVPISQSNVVGAVCATISALLYLRLLILTGVATSVSARTLMPAVAATLALPLTIGVGIVPLAAFEEGAAPILWVVLFFALPGTWSWANRRKSVAAVGSFLIALHVSLVALAECWTWASPWSHRGEFPIVAMNPAVWVIIPFERRFPDNSMGPSSPPFLPMILFYWLGLAANIVIARRWLVSNFDRLAGRIDGHGRRGSASGQP